jgi:hypothetical protein
MVALVALVAFFAITALRALVARCAFGTVRPLASILDATTAPFLILLDVTALFFSCAVPTLFFGKLVAAYVVPPSATNRATREMMSAGLGRLSVFMMNSPQ